MPIERRADPLTLVPGLLAVSLALLVLLGRALGLEPGPGAVTAVAAVVLGLAGVRSAVRRAQRPAG